MVQLSLSMGLRLPYTPDGFLLHSGVKDVHGQCLALLRLQGFRLVFVYAPPRFGKTHFCVRLSDDAVDLGQHPRILEGDRFLTEDYPVRELEFASGDVLVVDDADKCLEQLKPGASGEIVAFIERLRAAGAALVLVSGKELIEFEFDEHIASRLRAGLHVQISNPAANEMGEIVKAMARQRGFALDGRKLQYIERRMGPSVAAVDRYLERLIELSRTHSYALEFPLLSEALTPNERGS